MSAVSLALVLPKTDSSWARTTEKRQPRDNEKQQKAGDHAGVKIRQETRKGKDFVAKKSVGRGRRRRHSAKSWEPSRASSRSLVWMPPGAENPVIRPSAPRNRWQGTRSGQRFCPSAVPIAAPRPAAGRWPGQAARRSRSGLVPPAGPPGRRTAGNRSRCSKRRATEKSCMRPAR